MKALTTQSPLTLPRAAAALLALWLLAGPAAGADDASEYQKKLDELQENIEELKSELDSVKSERGELQEALEESESEIDELENNVDTLNEKIDEHDTELQSLEQQQKQLHRQRDGQKAQIAAQVRAAYRTGPQGPLRMLLGQNAPERISRLNKYHDYLLSARDDKLDRYLATLNKLDALQPQILAQRQSLERQRGQLNERQRQLQRQQQKRSTTLQKLAQVIADKDAKLAAERQDRARLARLLEEMTATLGSTNPSGSRFSRLRGKLPWPTDGELQHGYGSERVGKQLTWEGMVIEAGAGTPVIAVHSGVVVFADYLRGQGLLVIIDHGEGYMSLYAHNQTLLKRLGERVDAGEVIARVGNSGGRDNAALYFEIRHQGRPTNPHAWLARA